MENFILYICKLKYFDILIKWNHWLNDPDINTKFNREIIQNYIKYHYLLFDNYLLLSENRDFLKDIFSRILLIKIFLHQNRITII